jgi:hypothetical protein
MTKGYLIAIIGSSFLVVDGNFHPLPDPKLPAPTAGSGFLADLFVMLALGCAFAIFNPRLRPGGAAEVPRAYGLELSIFNSLDNFGGSEWSRRFDSISLQLGSFHRIIRLADFWGTAGPGQAPWQ